MSAWCSGKSKRALCGYLEIEARTLKSTGLAVIIETVGVEAHFT